MTSTVFLILHLQILLTLTLLHQKVVLLLQETYTYQRKELTFPFITIHTSDKHELSTLVINIHAGDELEHVINTNIPPNDIPH